MTSDHHSRSLPVLLIISLAIRLAWALLQPSTPAAIDRLPDQREYLSLGQNLLHRGSLSFFDTRFQQTVYAYRTPGYPAFIALLGASPLAIRLAQAFLDTSTILAIYLLARQLSGRKNLAMFAAFLVALNPFLIYFTGLILSETLFTAFLAWGLFFFIRRRIIFFAILFLLAVLVRPSAILLGPLLAIPAMANPAPGQPYSLLPAMRRGGIAVLTVAIVIFIGLLPWAFRNHRLLGKWIWTTTNSGITLYDGFHPGATGASDQQFLGEMPVLRTINEAERSQYLSDSAVDWIENHPGESLGLMLKKIARTWSPVPLSTEYARPVYQWIGASYAIPFDLLVIAGLFSTALRPRSKILLLIPALYFTAVHGMSVGSLRYRVPVEPVLAVVAAASAVRILKPNTPSFA